MCKNIIVTIICYFVISSCALAGGIEQGKPTKFQYILQSNQSVRLDRNAFQKRSFAWIFQSRRDYRSQRSYRYRNRTRNRPSYSMFAARRGPVSSRGTFVFDPKRLSWAAYDSNGRLVKSGHAVGGKGYCSDVRRSCRTPVGHFRVHAKRGANCVSSKYPLGRGGAKMPHCMFFRGGYAIHGSYDVPNYNASHGCIRVHPPAAAWLSRNFMRIGTRVIVRPYR